jgi:hypothetical protein
VETSLCGGCSCFGVAGVRHSVDPFVRNRAECCIVAIIVDVGLVVIVDSIGGEEVG